ncbi:erythromycin esterase family protein [Nonomuraea gerenzanensis]|uniref:Protein-L-isoaspartate O-methyltransferase n=1 Tax=Nonomuraea gerenzanensis TaxID=93944 RepID=A0A1M4E8Q5_9ACTN|nr:erythromycin esterase family protein [Nonomuraea gerenzanensis]UBU17460.1 erythromycin esterase family protein [Nonomuraea gerenzanensis]SBO95216.1 Protein-L-isoaspartate O-methyltransferase [Nonomuraea gerenzanensis]
MTNVEEVRRPALPLTGPDDLGPLLERVGEARFVLIGEATHGTHDFYAWRAELTRRLIAEKGFGFVAVEGDWPDCARIDHAVTTGADPFDAVYAFARWPSFMWANEEVLAFCRWLRDWNAARPPGARCGFHGLDVYSLWDSLRAIRRYAAAHLPERMESVMRALYCFESYGHDPQQYGLATRMVPDTCEDEVVHLLATLGDDEFGVRQNAEVVAGAERYYRAMVRGGPDSWNIRDAHMADTLDRLAEHHQAKGVVWAHNTHVGDARATDMTAAGMTNLGQLARERHREDVVLVGFGTHRGTVVAGDRWGAQHQVMPVPPARPASLEAFLHEALPGRDALFLVPPPGLRAGWYDEPMGHRAIGVVYHPERERWSNYVPTVVGRRYDAFLWLDETRAVRPLHGEPQGDAEPETYPTAM